MGRTGHRLNSNANQTSSNRKPRPVIVKFVSNKNQNQNPDEMAPVKRETIGNTGRHGQQPSQLSKRIKKEGVN